MQDQDPYFVTWYCNISENNLVFHTPHMSMIDCRCLPRQETLTRAIGFLPVIKAHIWWYFFWRLVRLFIWPRVSIPFNKYSNTHDTNYCQYLRFHFHQHQDGMVDSRERWNSTSIFTWFLQDRYRSMDARQRRGPEPPPEPVDKWFGILAFNSCNHSKRPEWCVLWQGGWSRISRIACIFLIFPSLGGKYSVWINLENGQTFCLMAKETTLRSSRLHGNLEPLWLVGEGAVRRLLEGRVTVLNWVMNQWMRQDSPCHVPVPYTTLFCRACWCVRTVFLFWRRVSVGYHV